MPISPNVPISPKLPNFFEIYLSNYFLSVMNDVIYKIDLRKSSLFNLNLIAFGRVLNSTHFVESYDTSFRTLTRLSFFEQNIYFCSHIAKCANIAKIFGEKTFGDIGPPVYDFTVDKNDRPF
jgi:hypothetical protein